MKQKKLIIFFPSIEKGGVEKNLFIISNFLSKKIKNISIVTSVPNEIDNKKMKVITTGFNIRNQNRFIKNLFCSYLLIKEIIKNKNVIVMSFQSNIYATLISYFFCVKVICRANASPKGWLKNPLKKFIYKIIMGLSSKIIVNSKEMKLEFKKDLNLNSFLIYNPLNKREVIAKSKEKSKINFLNKKDHLKIINIGRFTKQKDQITLLKALTLLKDKVKFQLILMGQGSEKKKLDNFIKDNSLNKNVRIVNYTKNPYPIIKKADLFILTSKYEGLPNVLLEAIALKKLIISSDCPTGPREILQYGKGGILFKTGNYIDLNKKIVDLIKKNKSQNKKIFLANKSLARFDYYLNLNKYLRLYQNFNNNY